MNKKKVLTGEKHHWWPKGLSKFWANTNGLIYRIDSLGNVINSNPKNFAQLSNGHNVVLSENSPWNFTFEHYFDNPDRNIRKVLSWLETFQKRERVGGNPEYSYLSQDLESENLNILRECILSLILRSPMYRNMHNLFVESFRGKLSKKQARNLEAFNIYQKYETLTQSSKNRGRFAVLFSVQKEFIFGDGFYTNLTATSEDLFGFKVAIPVTPNIAVIWSSPASCYTSPRLMALKADEDVVELINYSVQVYSKDYLFFRSQQPNLNPDFTAGEHRAFEYNSDPLKRYIDSLIKGA